MRKLIYLLVLVVSSLSINGMENSKEVEISAPLEPSLKYLNSTPLSKIYQEKDFASSIQDGWYEVRIDGQVFVSPFLENGSVSLTAYDKPVEWMSKKNHTKKLKAQRKALEDKIDSTIVNTLEKRQDKPMANLFDSQKIKSTIANNSTTIKNIVGCGLVVLNTFLLINRIKNQTPSTSFSNPVRDIAGITAGFYLAQNPSLKKEDKKIYHNPFVQTATFASGAFLVGTLFKK